MSSALVDASFCTPGVTLASLKVSFYCATPHLPSTVPLYAWKVCTFGIQAGSVGVRHGARPSSPEPVSHVVDHADAKLQGQLPAALFQ